MSDFNSQAEVWRWLLESEDNHIKYTTDRVYTLHLKDETLFSVNNAVEVHFSLSYLGRIKKLIPKKTIKIYGFVDTFSGRTFTNKDEKHYNHCSDYFRYPSLDDEVEICK